MNADSNINELYQRVVMDHYHHPRGKGSLPSPTHIAKRDNPLCGDEIELSLKIEEGKLQEIAFQAKGCALCQASASVMAEAIKFKSKTELKNLSSDFLNMLSSPPQSPISEKLEGDLLAFIPVRHASGRRNCVALAWDCLQEALNNIEVDLRQLESPEVKKILNQEHL